MKGLHVCSFVDGLYTVESPSGKTGVTFEDSRIFGPSKIDMRTGEPSEIPACLRWFWRGYDGWIEAGRPTAGKPISQPIGDLLRAVFR